MNPIAANPAAPPAERLYPIRTVAQLTQVNPITLRAWERRYNLIRPVRTPAGHRLYSDADIRRIREILDLSEQGIGLAQIAAILNQRTASAIPQPTSTPSARPQDHTAAPPESTDNQDSWPSRLELAVRAMNPTEVARIEQEVLLWLSPAKLFESVLLPVLRRLEQPDDRECRELARHWFSDRLRTRLYAMQEGQTRPWSQSISQIAVDQADGPRPLMAAELQLLLLLGMSVQIRLAPTTLNHAQTADLVSAWAPDGWLRLICSNTSSADTTEHTLDTDTMILACAPHDEGADAIDDSTKWGSNPLQGTPDQCYRRIVERIRRR